MLNSDILLSRQDSLSRTRLYQIKCYNLGWIRSWILPSQWVNSFLLFSCISLQESCWQHRYNFLFLILILTVYIVTVFNEISVYFEIWSQFQTLYKWMKTFCNKVLKNHFRFNPLCATRRVSFEESIRQFCKY